MSEVPPDLGCIKSLLESALAAAGPAPAPSARTAAVAALPASAVTPPAAPPAAGVTSSAGPPAATVGAYLVAAILCACALSHWHAENLQEDQLRSRLQ